MQTQDKIRAALAATFRALSGSSDRDLAREAVRLEPQVLALLTPASRAAKTKRRPQSNLNMSLTQYLADNGWWLDSAHHDATGLIRASSPDGRLVVEQTDREPGHWQVCCFDQREVLLSKAQFTHCPAEAIIQFMRFL